MLVEDGQMRWWGFDMRARWRRRVAVIASYAVMQIGVTTACSWDHPWPDHPFLVIVAMLGASILWWWASIFRDDSVVKSFEARPYLRHGIEMGNGLDERELLEQGSAEQWSLRSLMLLLGSFLGVFITHATKHELCDPKEIIGVLWTLMNLVLTLAQARVLWMEPDPRVLHDELQVLGEHGREA